MCLKRIAGKHRGRAWHAAVALFFSLAIALMAISTGTTRSYFIDTENATGNIFQALTPTIWTQTSQADFEAGILYQVDTVSESGNVKLAMEGASYYSSGTLASQVLDTGISGAVWDVLAWDETLDTGTDIAFEVRASDTLFLKDAGSPSWTAAGGTSPVTTGLPQGRYQQWRATLTTSDTSRTPVLSEVRVFYY